MKINNNTILITGATRGIGLAILEKFYPLDNKIIAVAKSLERLNELKKKFPNIVIFCSDLDNRNSISKLCDFIISEHHDINVIINNAGVQVNFGDKRIGENDRLEELYSEMQINYGAPIEIIYKLLPLLMNKKSSAIVNVTSALAFVPKKSAPGYCGTKAGLHIFTKSLRYQYENTPVKVFELIPSIIDTDMTKGRGKNKVSPEELAEKFIKGFENDKFEINIGKAGMLRNLQRISPRLADNILKNN